MQWFKNLMNVLISLLNTVKFCLLSKKVKALVANEKGDVLAI
jgi:hypothetical protein